MSSPKREAGAHGRPQAVALPWPGLSVTGRLLPLVLDEARQRHDDTLCSVLLGGMSRRQIDEIRFRPPGSAIPAGRAWTRLVAQVRRFLRVGSARRAAKR